MGMVPSENDSDNQLNTGHEDKLTESSPAENVSLPTEAVSSPTPKKRTKLPVFARPAYSSDVMNAEGKRKYDQLPSWQRHLIKRVIDHGDLKRASIEAGVATHASQNVDFKLADSKSITEALTHGGITPDVIIKNLHECLEANNVKFDKHQNPIPCVDLKLKLETLKLICALRGDLGAKDKKPIQNLDDLFEDTPT